MTAESRQRTSELTEIADRVRRHVWVDEAAVDAILDEVQEGKLAEQEGIWQLRQLESAARKGPLSLTAREANKEWSSLLEAMAEEATGWQQIARRQFMQGFVVLPAIVVVVIGILLYLSTTLPGGELAVSAQPLLGACLAVVAAHAFLVFRVHQQARVAAERLSEKRAAILFLRVAMSRTDPEESARLLQAGTAMFLGHYAVPAVPLQPSDKPASPSIPLQGDRLSSG